MSNTPPPPTPMGSVPLMLSDASNEDWATIGVNVLGIAFVPQGGGAPVMVYTAPSGGANVNLVQLDQIEDLLGNVQLAPGTYTGAVLTIGGNPGDVALTVSSNPEPGFALSPGTVVPSSQIQIQGTQGSAGSLTVPVQLTFEQPLIVSPGTNTTGVDIEFDLKHPAFIIGHTPPGGATLWAVNFKGPVRQRPVAEISHLVLRHMYGTVTAVAADNSAITITRDMPTRPIVNPETAVATSQSLSVLADAANGTLFYDLDAKTRSVLKDFSALASSLDGRYVRIAARYQENGTLVAVRIWASNVFNTVFVSPEGHVAHVDALNDFIWVTNEQGVPVKVGVNANTEFFFRAPQNGLADATPIATGPAFLANDTFVRGFKVHVTPVDALATPMIAQSIDIETASFSGAISGATSSSFTYTHRFGSFNGSNDDYQVALGYISSSAPNGQDARGNAILGFKYWEFAYPLSTLVSGSGAIASFTTAVNGGSGGFSFAGNSGLHADGFSPAVWGDPANPNGWSAPLTVLLPAPLPLGAVSSGLTAVAGSTTAYTFTMAFSAGGPAGTVDISAASGGATLVYQIDRTNGVVTVSPIDITTSSGLRTLTAALAATTPVKVYGVPQSDGSFKSYVLAYFTGTPPAS